MLTWGNLEVLALLFMAILIWFAFYKAYTRPDTIIMLPPTVKERINEFYGMGTVSRDSIDKFLKNTLQELHLLTQKESHFSHCFWGVYPRKFIAGGYFMEFVELELRLTKVVQLVGKLDPVKLQHDIFSIRKLNFHP